MIPPRPAVIAHGKVLRKRTPAPYSSRGCPARLFVSSARLRQRAHRGSLKMSLLRRARAGSRGSRLETFRQRATVPTLLWVWTDYRLLKRRLRAHRRRFARSPRFPNRAGLKIVGAANDLRNTLSGKTRNEIDSHLRHQKT